MLLMYYDVNSSTNNLKTKQVTVAYKKEVCTMCNKMGLRIK